MPICVSYRRLDELQKKLEGYKYLIPFTDAKIYGNVIEAEELFSAISELRRCRKRLAEFDAAEKGESHA